MPPRFDHVMYGGPDLPGIIRDIGARTGVEPAYGGRHDVGGTHNAVLGLGGGRYLELIGADPDAPPEVGFAGLLRSLPEPRVIMWAVAVDDLDAAVADARAAGYDPGEVMTIARDAPEHGRIEWRVCFGGDAVIFGVVPFLIDWGGAPHPSADAPTGCTLVDVRGEHPSPAEVEPTLRALGVELDVTRAERPALVVTLDTPSGAFELR